jgi:hypothetical protein
MQLNPWETPAAPATPLMACCTSRFGPLCAHHVKVYGPAHFAPAYVHQLRVGMVLADFEATATGEVLYREVTEVRSLLGNACTLTMAGQEHLVHAYGTLNVSQSDAVTRRRVSEALGGGEG